jgi:hypothetical protein
MGTFGFPADSFAQTRLQIEQGPSPPESVSPEGVPGATSLTARRAARRSPGLGGAGRHGSGY